jgi:hypothetical protein
MDGVEIVITPRTLERIAYSTVIAVLLILVVVHWGGGATCSDQGQTTANAVLENEKNTTNNTVAPVQASAADPCKNGAKDGSESDVDCGGSCTACAEFKACNVNADCSKGLDCFQHIKCMKATCEDGIKNQDETNVDCGGACSGYWWKADGKCHSTVEPSGKLDLKVSASIDRSPNSGNAIIKTITLNFDNGMTNDLAMTVELFARTPSGGMIFENVDGEIPINTVSLTVNTGSKATKTLDMGTNTRNTLPGVKSTDDFQIVAVVKDSQKKTVIDEFSWTNG